ncbi:MAG: hypothetical protein OXG41_08905 [Acidimicrobiaceae bacterium]|nr:hypothetical protein [Acidimicrobiaceae bacterium]
MTEPKPPDRRDGWDDRDYTPTRPSYKNPITLQGIEDTIPEDLTNAVLNYRPHRHDQS